MPVPAIHHGPVAPGERVPIVAGQAEHRREQVRIETVENACGEVGGARALQPRDEFFSNRDDVPIDAASEGPEHREFFAEIAAEAGHAIEPRLRAGLEVGVIDKDGGDVVVQGDPIAVPYPVPVERVVFAHELQRGVRVTQEFRLQEHAGVDQIGGFLDALPLINLVGAVKAAATAEAGADLDAVAARSGAGNLHQFGLGRHHHPTPRRPRRRNRSRVPGSPRRR